MGQRCSDTRIINFGELSKNTFPPSFSRSGYIRAKSQSGLGGDPSADSASRSRLQDNVVVPKENLLGKEGDGFKVSAAIKCFSGELCWTAVHVRA